MITDRQLKEKWFKFFEKHGFKKIEGFSIIPENDPTVLFTTAGMHPLVPYLLGEKHPAGDKIYDVQRCIRTSDIDSVGDGSHLTFFEMLGNWTLGKCDKKEMIKLSFEFLTSPEYLGLDKNRLAVTVFAGNDVAPKDEETFEATTLNIEQIATILKYMKQNLYNLYTPTLISVLTGSRRGETLGLTWNDIDFENNLIYFRNNIVNVNGKPINKTTLKTKNSKRVIAMADFLKEELIEHKNKFAPINIDDHVCSNIFQGEITPDYITHCFHDFMKNKYNINMREHDLRHNFSQLIYDNEELLLTKSKIMGHSNIDITKNVYTRHTVNQRMFDIVNSLGNMIKEKIYA